MFGCGEEAAAPTGAIDGSIQLESGEPAAGTTVNFVTQKRPTRADAQGRFTYGEVSPGAYTLIVRRTGYQTVRKGVEVVEGETADVSVTLQPVNASPRLDGIAVNPQEAVPGDDIEVTVSAMDPNGDSLDYSFAASQGFDVDTSMQNEATISTPREAGAQGTVSIEVSDGDGGTTFERVIVSTLPNSPPSIGQITASTQTLQPGATTTLSASASDDEGDVSYQWSASNGWSVDDPPGSDVTVSAPDRHDAESRVELTVTDADGASVSAGISLSTVANGGPSITELNAQSATLAPAESTQLVANGSDPNGDSLSYQWTTPEGWSVDTPSSDVTTLTAPDEYDRRAKLKVTVTDEGGNDASGTIFVSTKPNAAPSIQQTNVSPAQPTIGGTVDVSVDAMDPDGESLSYNWSVLNSEWSKSGSGASITLQAPAETRSATLVEVTATDPNGVKSTRATAISTAPNEPPRVNSHYVASNPMSPDSTVTATVLADDVNGDSLSYTWSVDNTSWSVTGSGNTATLNSPDTHSSSTLLTAVVSDGRGNSTTSSITVRTREQSYTGPTITSAPDLPALVSTGRQRTFTYQAAASDPDDSNLSWTVSAAPNTSVSIDNSGLLSWTPGFNETDTTFSFTVTASDGVQSTSQTFSVQTREQPLRVSPAFKITDSQEPGQTYHQVAVGDFDGDNRTDFATTQDDSSQYDNALNFVLSSEDYRIHRTVPWANQNALNDCSGEVAADVNGDGLTDIVSVCWTSNDRALVTWINTIPSSGSFSPGKISVYSSYDEDYMRTHDLNDDGAAEVFFFDDGLQLLMNDGTGSFNTLREFELNEPPNESYYVRSFELGNFDTDGEPEVLISWVDSGDYFSDPDEYYVSTIEFESTPQGGRKFAASRSNTFKVPESINRFVTADFDDDGVEGFAYKTALFSGSPAVKVYRNDASNKYVGTASVYPASTASSWIHEFGVHGEVSADLNQNGRTDLIFGDGAESTVYIGYGTANAGLTQLYETTHAPYGQEVPDDIFVGNYNDDGYPDIFVYNGTRFSVFY